MGWIWKEEHLDLILVPFGLCIMFIYHLCLLYKCLNNREDTAIVYENNNKNAWVQKILQVEPNERGYAIAVLNGQLSASTSLSSISLVLCSLLGALLGNSSNNFITSNVFLGDTSKSTNSLKHIAILSCFLLAFSCFVQATRHFVHASFLICMPTGDVPINCIQKAVIRGSNFWAVGLRALYFATTLLLWIFGPIPMFIGSVATVIVLHFLDITKEPMIQYGPDMKIKGQITSVVGAFNRNGRP